MIFGHLVSHNNKRDKMSINCIRTLIEDANVSNPDKIAFSFGNEKN